MTTSAEPAATSAFAAAQIPTPRLVTNVWTSGQPDGVPLLLVHGNISTGGFWKYVAQALPSGIRVLAPDLRGFGATEPKPIDATRGLGDMVDDVRALLEEVGLADSGGVHAAGWSMGGGVLQQYLLAYPDDLASVTLVAPVSPYGYGGTKGADGEPCADDYAGSGAGAANPDFVARMAAKDASDDGSPSAPRTVMMTFYGPGANAPNVDADFLVAELLTTTVGEDFYPGDAQPSPNWPTTAPGSRGVLNAMSPKHFNTASLFELDRKPPITWVHGAGDQIVNDGAMFDVATLGQLGVVPGWPGEQVMPPQPMVSQTREVLRRYGEAGGIVREVAIDDADHGIPLAMPQRLADEIMTTIRDAS